MFWPVRFCRRPVGPRKINEPIGFLASFKPARERRMARHTAEIASFWPTTRLWRNSSMRRSLFDSSSSSLKSGMPVIFETT